ncbi:MAG: hypothetical protein NWE83_07155 [Candidatus Bathyarchaeota archaeon]|nr:hypothetical protein [Candidatus Bathyarchaeota archaeon]
MFNIFNTYRHFSWVIIFNGNLGLMECCTIGIITKNIARARILRLDITSTDLQNLFTINPRQNHETGGDT